MADAYAKEFEKWLQKTSDSSQEDETDGDLMDEEEDMFVDVEDHSEDEEKMIWEGGKKASNAVLQRNDSAPFLLDDDDEEFPCEKVRFEEEPPVLEPVLKMARDTFQSDHSDSGHKPPKYNRNCFDYSRKKSSEKSNCLRKQAGSVGPPKGKCGKQSIQADAETGPERYRRYSNASKDKESGNIFDKFSSMSEVMDDNPPPLIPSPHGVPVIVASPNDRVDKVFDPKLTKNSPDFCAMEADSTSEITGAQMQRVSTSTAGLGDLSLECDSTCMLGASPVVVSPASLSAADGDDGHESGSGGPFRKTSMESDGKVEILSEETDDRSEFVGCDSKEDEEGKTHRRNRAHPAPCLELSRMDGMSVLAGELVQKTQKVEELEEPPVLPVMRLSTTGLRRSRHKRHTIDTPETFSHSGKPARFIPSPTADTEDPCLDNDPPPKLSHILETAMPSGSEACFDADDKSATSLTHLSRKDWSCCAREKKRSHGKKRRRRCNTVPFVEMDQVSGHFSEELHKFVQATSDLSALQSRAHKLLGLLFPQLETELATMSPESSRFESLLRETIGLMQQQEKQGLDGEAHEKLRKGEDAKFSTGPTDKLSHMVKVEESFPSHQDQLETASHSILSFPGETGEKAIGKEDKMPPVVCDIMVPELSRLTIDNGASLSLGLRVLLPRDPTLMLARFSSQLCHALQLLLPELTASLISELQSSPSDLLVFMDNVIASNQRSREGSSPSQH